MLLIENKKCMKIYTIKNKYLCECGLLNEKNVCNACMKYKERKLKKDIVRLCNCIQCLSCQTIRTNKKGLNNWIETYNNDHYKTKKERHRLNVHKKLLLELNKVDR